MGAYKGRYERRGKRKYTWIPAIGYALIFAFLLYLLGTFYASRGQLQMPFGWGTAVVLSNSMKPTFEKGDLLIVRKVETEPKIGDVVIYQGGKSLVVHRVIAYDNGLVTTKGDANSAEDPVFTEDKVLATMAFVVPGVGTVIRSIQTPWGMVLLILLLLGFRELPGYLDRRAAQKTKTDIQHDIRFMREETRRILQKTEVRKK